MTRAWPTPAAELAAWSQLLAAIVVDHAWAIRRWAPHAEQVAMVCAMDRGNVAHVVLDAALGAMRMPRSSEPQPAWDAWVVRYQSYEAIAVATEPALVEHHAVTSAWLEAAS